MRLLRVAGLLFLCSCGGRREVTVSEQWTPGPGPCSPPSLRLLVHAEAGARVRIANREATAVAPRNAPGIAAASLEWKADEVPAGPVLDVDVEDGGKNQQIKHTLRRPREVALMAEPVPSEELSAFVQIPRKLQGTGGRTSAMVKLDDDGIRFQFNACHATRGRSTTGSVDVRGDAVVFRVPLQAVMSRSIKPNDTRTMDFPVTLHGADGQTEQLAVRVAESTLARLLFGAVPENPLEIAQPHAPGGPFVVIDGPPAKLGNVRLLNADEPTLTAIAAVAFVHTRASVLERCTYIGGWLARVERRRWNHDVTVYETQSGRLLARRTFTGSAPPPCPAKMVFRGPETNLDGENAPQQVIDDWISRL